MAGYQSGSYLWAEKQTEVAPMVAHRVEEGAGHFWDLFYKRNSNKFYKDRHYFGREWPMLCTGDATVLEVGCGAGNTVFPLLDMNPQLKVYACDFAPTAVDLVKAHPAYASGRVHAFVADLTVTDLVQHVPPASVDYVTMVFVLSAVPPHKMPAAVANVARTLRPGGHILFRDYAQGDLAQERRELAGARRLSERFFLRGDGTCCFHYQPEELCDLFRSAGLTCVDLHIHQRDVENKKRGISMRRQWLQAVFQLTGTPPAFPPPPGSTHTFPPASPTQPDVVPAAHVLAPVMEPGSADMEEDDYEEGEGDDAMHTSDGGGNPQLHTPRAPAAPAASQVMSPGAAAMLFHSGTLLTGAAGRLASHAAALPGVPSGRAQLPDTLDSADELACSLSPGVGVRGEGHSQPWYTAAVHRSGVEQLEADLEREFFSTIQRDTQEVVAEELAAAGVAGITLADVDSTISHVGLGHQQQQQPVVCVQPSRQAACAAYQVTVAPGMHLACTDPSLAAMAGGHGGVASAAQAELLLARLIASCSPAGPGNGSFLGRCMRDGQVLQLGVGPGALAGMLAVRWGGARRVWLTHPDRPSLEARAGCVHANAARLVVERIKVAQLDLRSDKSVHNVLGHISQQGGVSVVLCADMCAALSSASAGAASGTQADAFHQLLHVCSLAARGQSVERPSAVKALAGGEAVDVPATFPAPHANISSSHHRPACLVSLVPAAQAVVLAGQVGQSSEWRVDAGAGQELTELLKGCGTAGGLTLEPLCLVWRGNV